MLINYPSFPDRQAGMKIGIKISPLLIDIANERLFHNISKQFKKKN